MQYLGPSFNGNISAKPWAANSPLKKFDSVRSLLDGEIYARTNDGQGTVDPADDIVNFVATSYKRTISLPPPCASGIASEGTGTTAIATGTIKVRHNGAPGQRVKVLEHFGRGTLNFAGIFQSATVARIWTIEIKIDGRIISNASATTTGARSCISWVGNFIGGGGPSALPYVGVTMNEGVEFKRSVEVYLSVNVSNITNDDLFMYSLTGQEAIAFSPITFPTPPAPGASTASLSLLNKNDLDFYMTYAQLGAFDKTYHNEMIVTVSNAANFFNPGADHMIFALDCDGEGGQSNPHCGPVIRNGQNIFSYGRGFIVLPNGTVQSERWIAGVPIVTTVTNTSGQSFSPTALTSWTIRINAGYVTSNQFSTRMRVRIYSGAGTGGTLVFDGQTAEIPTWQWTYDSYRFRRAFVGGIGTNFVSPNATGCVEQLVSRNNPSANFSISNFTLNGYQ